MMNIQIKDVLTLSDGKKYLVTSKVEKDSKTYLLITDINDFNNNKVVYENIEHNSVIELEDEKIVNQLKPLFLKVTLKDLKGVLEDNN